MSEIKDIKNQLENNSFLSTPKNNKLLLGFIEAKQNGEYERLVFERSINDDSTAVKKSRNLKKIDDYFQKDFDTITEDEIIEYRKLLNEDKIFKNITQVKWKDKKPYFQIKKTNKPLKFRTKKDYTSNFKEFWKYIQEYHFQKTGKELPNITRYLKMKKPEDFQTIKVEFIPDDDILTLLNNIRNRNFKAYIQLSLMSGARPCEAIKIKFGDNLYKDKGKWIIKLPKIKGVSYDKFPMVIDMYEDELIPYFKSLKLKEGDYVFKLTPQTIQKLMKHYTTKYLNKPYTPKILRKTARMLRTNAGYTEQWINKLMGHAPGTKVTGHYVNHSGLKNEPIANEKLKAQQYPSLKRDYERIKLQVQAQQEQMAEMVAKMTDIEDIKKELSKRKKD